MNTGGKRRWRDSIEVKLIAGFGGVIVVILAASLFIYAGMIRVTREINYEKMNSQAEFCLQSLDTEVKHVKHLLNQFFTDRNLVFLVWPDMTLTPYEKRDALLSVMERMDTLTGVSALIQNGTLYLPKSGYTITSSSIRRMEEEDREEMTGYGESLDGELHYDGGFFVAGAGAPRIRSDTVPNYVLAVRFSEQQIREKLSSLCSIGGSGCFLYFEEGPALIEYSQGDYVGEEILKNLKLEQEGSLGKRSIRINGEKYLVFAGGSGEMGLFVEYMKEEAVTAPITRFRNLVIVLFALMLLAAVFYGIYVKRLIHNPIETLLEAFQRVKAGDWSEHILLNRQDEFCDLYDGFNDMEDQMGNMIEQVYIQTNLTQRAELKQLQAQIAPHFLFNSFFSLSSKIKRGDYELAQEMAMYLGDYFQYLTRNESDYVQLWQEAEHAQNYAAIQGARFIYRISVSFAQIPDSFREISVPRLILQPLLENAFEHGLENKIRDGLVQVRFVETPEEYQVWVEDNGDISEEKLEEIREGLKRKDPGETSAIFNIHRRLQIYYREKAGLRVRRSELGGLCILIFVSRKAEESNGPEPADRG